MKFCILSAVVLLGVACNENTSSSKSSPPSDSLSTVDVEGVSATVYTTADSSNLRLSITDTITFGKFGQPLESQPCVFVDPNTSFQTITGIGAALTDASAETFAKLPKERQQEFLRAYFSSSDGIGYTLARTNIHSCDFSSAPYTYVTEKDSSLASFSIAHDMQYKVPFIQQAIAAAGGNLPLFASPWSPPAWMKDNNDLLHGGKLLPQYYQAWANYYVKFIEAYEKEKIPVWGLSIQNEPMARQRWESCIYTAEEERDFLKNYLGPTLEKAGMGNRKIIAWDHNRDLLYQRASTILNDPAAAKYVWGIGFHWYETWTGGDPQFLNLQRVHEQYPNTNLIFTEGCNGPFNRGQIGHWNWGEIYGRNMINDFNNGTCAWTDWNILLDETGGPNHVQNFCFAPVHADTKTGELIYMNAFYYIGHFSKFVKPGAKRIISSSSRSELLTTAFKNEKGKTVVVVMNDSNKKIPYHLWVGGKAAQLEAKPHSIVSIVW